MAQEIVKMGFDTLEISHGLKVSLLPGIQRAYAKGLFKVSGVHNFCPSPVEVMIDAPDCYEFTSHREFERERALKLTLDTFDLAKKLDANYVVLHMGSVPMKNHTKRLTQMLRDGKLNDRDFVKLKLKFIQARERLAPTYYKRAIEALSLIADRAAELEIHCAVESRSRYEDMPSEREMLQLQETFKDHPYVGYWHDFGHVQLKENLQLLDHEEWLRSMQPYLVGCHLHDVVWPARDHRVPLAGSVAFERLMPMVAPGKPVVWELSPSRKKAHIKRALPLWKERFGT
jgi:sugar phosphate isomerase/epimerase